MAEKFYNKKIAEVINTFLTMDDWRYSFNKENGLFNFNLNIKGAIREIRYVIGVEENCYLVYAVSPISVDNNDAEKMSAMAQFICRANYGLKNGNFELDMRDGEIRYKCYVDCADIVPSLAVVKNSIYTVALTFGHYSAGIIGVSFGLMTPEEAIAKCE